MLLDILIFIPLIFFTLLGLRDGIVRKLVATIVLIIALFLGQIYMRDLGNFLAERNWISKENAPMCGYFIIFFSLAMLQCILYRILAGKYKIGGFADRIGGVVLGFAEGIIFISTILYILALSGSPGRDLTKDSKLYKPVVNVAPQILDIITLAEEPKKIENLELPIIGKVKSSSGDSIVSKKQK